MIWDNVKYIKYRLIVFSAVLLMASVSIFSSPDYNTLIRSAASMPVSGGMKMLDSLSRVQGSLGAQALRVLGDHAFIKEDYKKAAALYSQAAQSDSLSIYRHLHALAAALDGQISAAKNIWNVISEDLSDPLSALAALHLAYLEMQARNWEEAYALLQSAAPADTASPLYIPFVWEMLECSRELKRGERVAIHEKQLSAFRGHILESGTSASFGQPVTVSQQNNRQGSAVVNTANVNAEKPHAAAVRNADRVEDKKVDDNPVGADRRESRPQNQQRANFTIQVGAFGSKANAENLVRRLSENYSDVIIFPPAIGGPVLYRVRVGVFANREEAEVTAQKLSASGMSPQILENR
ncbi:MAG: SPOR domain-containing protein [Chitinispirillia bacterium]|nr:SPOR domain-containing protein [Chitinispirillia bacterium]